MNPMRPLSWGLLCAGWLNATALEPLPYLHPGLEVDLGVGLWAWPVPVDADGDGDFDLIVSCPDKPSNGVWLFENATGDTAVDPMPVFRPARRLGPTVHYVMPSYVDGGLRVLTPGREHPGFVRGGLDPAVPLPIPARFYQPPGPATRGPRLRHNQWRYVDYDGDGALDLVVGIEDWSFYGWDDAWNARGEWTMGPLHGFVFRFRNLGTTAEPEYARPLHVEAGGGPVDVFGCPSPNFTDFDADGDLDLLCGEFLDGFTYFENAGTRTDPRYRAGRRVRTADGRPLRMDLQMIVPVAFDWDRDGDPDLIVGDEDGRVAFVENTGRLDADRTPVFAAPRYFRQQADTLKCGALATPYPVDWDGDGDQDILAGNTAGYIEWFENLSGPGVALPRWAAPRRLEAGGGVFRVMAGPNGSIQGPAEAKWGYTTFSVADWDRDGLPDIVLNSIRGRVEWLRNLGPRSAPRLDAPRPVEVAWPGPPPKPAWTWWQPGPSELVTQWRTTPVVHDFTGDGWPDIALLDPEGFLALYERDATDPHRHLRPPRRAFVDRAGEPLRLNARTAGGSGRRKLCVTDWDGDGEPDFLVNSANADLLRGLGRDGDVWRFEAAGSLADRNIEGHDVSPSVADFDGDGVPDFLGGAEDGRLYFMANPRSAPGGDGAATTASDGTAALGLPLRLADVPSRLSGLTVHGWLRQALAAGRMDPPPGTAWVEEYRLNCPPFEPGVSTRRWIALPPGGRIGFDPEADWSLPPGAVLVRHTVRSDGTGSVPVETRLLVAGSGSAWGAGFRWREDGSDANRVDDADLVDLGSGRQWLIPGADDGLVLPALHPGHGSDLSARQLNRPDDPENPLVRWRDAGWLAGVPADLDVGRLPRLFPADAPVAAGWRVRSHLDVNCSPCHQPGGPARGFFDARLATPLERAGLVGGTVAVNAFGIPDAQIIHPGHPDRSVLHYRLSRTDAYRMPPGVHHSDLPPILPVLEEWIRGLAVPTSP